MTELIGYLLVGVFTFLICVVIYTLAKNKFKLEKPKNDVPLFKAKSKEQRRTELKWELIIGTAFIITIVSVESCTN